MIVLASVVDWQEDFENCASSTSCNGWGFGANTISEITETDSVSPTHSYYSLLDSGVPNATYKPGTNWSATGTPTDVTLFKIQVMKTGDGNNNGRWSLRDTSGFNMVYLNWQNGQIRDLENGDVVLGNYDENVWDEIWIYATTTTRYLLSLDAGESWLDPIPCNGGFNGTVRTFYHQNYSTTDYMYFDDIEIIEHFNPVDYYSTDTELTYINPEDESTQVKHCSYIGCGAWGSYILYFGDDKSDYDNIRVMIFDTFGSSTELLTYDDYDPTDFDAGDTIISVSNVWPDDFGEHVADWVIWGFAGIDSDLLYSTSSTYIIIDYASSTEYLQDKIDAITSDFGLCSDDPCAGVSSTTDEWYEITDDLMCWGLWIGNWLICPADYLVLKLHDKFYDLKNRVPYSAYFYLTDYVSNLMSSTTIGDAVIKMPIPTTEGDLEFIDSITSSTLEDNFGTTTPRMLRTGVGYLIWLIVAGLCLVMVFAVIIL